MQCTCERCGKPFNEKPARVREGRGRFCSKVCRYAPNAIQVSGDVAFMELTDHLNNLKAAVKFDAADVPMIKELGKRWAPSWSESHKQYRAVARTENGSVLMHRWLMNAPAGMLVDHINHDTLDNRRSNLRLVTHSENEQNRRGATRKSKTGVRGVYKDSRRGTYYVEVKVNGVRHYAGGFLTLEEAEREAVKLRRKHMTHSQD